MLEHIDDHVGALRSAQKLVRPGGAIVMLVPAFVAMSRFDHDIGHYRRYTKETLGAAYRHAGIELEQLAYVNAPGLLAWLVAMKWFKRGTPGEGVLLRAWDRFVVPVARRAETLKSPPFGQSLLAVGRHQQLKPLLRLPQQRLGPADSQVVERACPSRGPDPAFAPRLPSAPSSS